MYKNQITLSEATSIFIGFFLRFAIVAAGLAILLWGTGKVGGGTVGLSAASLGINIPSFLLMLGGFFISGIFAVKMTVGSEISAGQIVLRNERRAVDSSRDRRKRHIHSNPLSRNPTTTQLEEIPQFSTLTDRNRR